MGPTLTQHLNVAYWRQLVRTIFDRGSGSAANNAANSPSERNLDDTEVMCSVHQLQFDQLAEVVQRSSIAV